MNWRSLLACIIVMVATACDNGFSPIEPSDLHISIFGYLDASADTQWIRVTRVRPVALTVPDPQHATVVVEEVGTDHVIELRDSVFRFSAPNSHVGSEGVYLHNYWTTEQIEPDATYQFTARLEGESPSEATVKIPATYGVELWLAQGQASTGDYLRLVGLRHVAFVVVITSIDDGCGSVVERAHFGTGSADTVVQMIPIYRAYNRGRADGCGPPHVNTRQIWIVGSGTAWPNDPGYEAGTLNVPDALSNISYARGYLGGVLTHLIPYDHCQILDAGRSTDYCRLHYDAASVTLRGIVRDARCGGGNLSGARLELREVDPEPPIKIRFASSNSSGAYVIGALEPGKRYALRVAHGEEFHEYADTLEFTPGADVTYGVALRGKCGG